MTATVTHDAGSTSPRQAGQAERRRRILNAAVTLFEAKGFEGATTDEIAAEAKVTKRTLYRYVGSKEELLFDIHEEFMTDLFTEVADTTGSPEFRFRAMVDSHIADLASHLPSIKVFFEELKHLSPAKRSEIVAERQKYESLVHDVLEAGIADGSFRQLDVRSTTRCILGAMNEGYRWYQESGPYTASQIGAQASHLFLNGLASPAQRRSERAPSTLPDGAPTENQLESEDEPMNRIVEAATHLFSAQGYHRTSTQEIADAAKLTKGAVFYYVRYKEEALLQIHDRLFQEINDVLAPIENENRPSLDVLADIVMAYTTLVASNREAMAVVSEERKYLPPESAQSLSEREVAFQAILERTLRRGMLAGEVATEDAHIATQLIFGIMNSIYRWYRPNAGRSPAELGAELVELTLQGIAAHPTN